jgi:hypothetical protein
MARFVNEVDNKYNFGVITSTPEMFLYNRAFCPWDSSYEKLHLEKSAQVYYFSGVATRGLWRKKTRFNYKLKH